jgi:hypothetical protein
MPDPGRGELVRWGGFLLRSPWVGGDRRRSRRSRVWAALISQVQWSAAAESRSQEPERLRREAKEQATRSRPAAGSPSLMGASDSATEEDRVPGRRCSPGRSARLGRKAEGLAPSAR